MTEASKADRVYRFIGIKTGQLYRMKAKSTASLAQLRRGAGKRLSECPEAWNVVLDGMDEDLLSFRGSESYAENAIWTALTLYGAHQQGKEENMSSGAKSLGAAIKSLIAKDGGNEQAIIRRFNMIITAHDAVELSQHARGIMQLLKSNNIPLDYPQFAKDLYLFQFLESQNSIRLRWGEDFYRRGKK